MQPSLFSLVCRDSGNIFGAFQCFIWLKLLSCKGFFLVIVHIDHIEHIDLKVNVPPVVLLSAFREQ